MEIGGLDNNKEESTKSKTKNSIGNALSKGIVGRFYLLIRDLIIAVKDTV